jgi:hypothetical protein
VEELGDLSVLRGLRELDGRGLVAVPAESRALKLGEELGLPTKAQVQQGDVARLWLLKPKPGEEGRYTLDQAVEFATGEGEH